jgi:hypothetical protein
LCLLELTASDDTISNEQQKQNASWLALLFILSKYILTEETEAGCLIVDQSKLKLYTVPGSKQERKIGNG